jgi:hypothetical protein
VAYVLSKTFWEKFDMQFFARVGWEEQLIAAFAYFCRVNIPILEYLPTLYVTTWK